MFMFGTDTFYSLLEVSNKSNDVSSAPIVGLKHLQ